MNITSMCCLRGKWTAVLGLFLLPLLFQGCKSVAVSDQRLLSKPNMTFSDSYTYSYQPRLTVQTEPGSASSGGAQAAGCTSCK